jgi:hypothetical protein
MMRRVPVNLAVLALLCVFPALSRAQGVVIGTEDATNGFVGPLLDAAGAPLPITVASDGEAAFDPFGFGADTSDGIRFGGPGWVQAPGFDAAFAPGFWTPLSDGVTWVLPASTPAGTENEPGFEPTAGWILPGFTWPAGTPPLQTILDEDGRTISDTFTLTNGGPNGEALLTFTSDPPVPEPASITLLAIGLGIAGAVSYRLRKKTS